MLPGPWCVFSFLVKPTKLLFDRSAKHLFLIRIQGVGTVPIHILPRAVHSWRGLQLAIECHRQAAIGRDPVAVS